MRGVSDAEATALLRDLVSTPSVSGEEAAAVALLVERMREMGYRSRIDGAGNAVGELGSESPDAREVMLLGHIDTVSGWIDIREDSGELWGRGSVDAKGPLCAFVCGAAGAVIPDGVRVIVIGAVGEETPTSPGACFVRDTMREPSCVLIGEPSGWERFTIGYKGRLLIEAEFTQACGHSAGPEGGVAERACAWWDAVRAWAEHLSGGREGPFERVQATIQSVRTESDGLTDRATMLVGFRLPPWLSPDDAERKAHGLSTDVTALRAFGHTPAHREARSCEPALALAGAIAGEGGRARPVVKTGTADMNTLAAKWRCPIVAYGPGESALDHTPEERLSIDEYLRAVRVVRGAVESLAGAVTRDETAVQ
jgi:LysW-gamma-L-lysine carboxypeptidase